MRVLMTTDTVGGVWTYALQLAESLAPHNVRVDLATLGGALSDSQRDAATALPNVCVHESSFRLEWMEDPWEDVRAAGEWLLELADEVRPDVVHLNDYSQGALDWSVPVLMAGHSCVLSWHEAVRGEPAGPEWEVYRGHVTRGLRGADLVVAPTGAMLDSLEQFYGPLPAGVVIPNGRECDLERPMLMEKQSLIFAAGRLWDEAKNIEALSAAARDVAWPVYVAGDARHPDGGAVDLPNLISLGRLEPAAMGTWFRAASIYAHPARYEPFGLAPLEAALGGCALVLADIPTLREVWGKAALFVSPDRPGELSQALSSLIESPSLRANYAERAWRRASRYTAVRMARNYFEAYRRLLAPAKLATAIT